ncbi:MAG: NAD(P)/FAD-dependent oxidoreductase [Acidimicrobiia bacterium]
MSLTARAVVCGAGIAGVATTYHLVVEEGIDDVLVIDPRPPLTLTSDKSTECYRNWWPNGPMVGLMNRSIDLLQQMAAMSNDAFHLNRRGYLYVTARPETLSKMTMDGRLAESLGAGDLRIHNGEGYLPNGPRAPADGADLFGSGPLLRRHFPFLTDAANGGLHVRRAGWFSAQQLGRWMLDRATAEGCHLLRAEVSKVETTGGRVSRVMLSDGTAIQTPVFVNAAGPMLGQVAGLLGIDLPIYSEVHIKVGFRDHLGVVPRDAPMVIWSDPQRIDWTADERRLLEEEGRHDLLGEMPAACHGRPEGGLDSPWLLALWEYHRIIQEPVWPLPEDPLYPETVMRGMTTMVPGLARYRDRLPQPVVDGGYYTKTRENRPLIGPLPIEGAYVIGAFSGFGVMAAAAAGELIGRHVAEGSLPSYARAFLPSRYDDPDYVREVATLNETGQI